MLRTRLQERRTESIQARISVGDKVGTRFVTSQGWKRAVVTFDWPSEEPTLPKWRDMSAWIGRVVRKAMPRTGEVGTEERELEERNER